MSSALSAIWNIGGILIAGIGIAGGFALAVTEFIGGSQWGKQHGFPTISEAAQLGAAHGDYRLGLLVFAAIWLFGLWWLSHWLLRV